MRSAHAAGSHAFRWAADSNKVRPGAFAESACQPVVPVMLKYFIFERSRSGRLLWMGEAADLEEVESKLEALAESNPGSDYFAFDVEKGTKLKIFSPHDDVLS